jgi:hypothetical protein
MPDLANAILGHPSGAAPGLGWTLIAHAIIGGPDSSATTAAINTTGANLIVLTLSGNAPGGGVPPLDNRGNTYLVAIESVEGGTNTGIYYKQAPTGVGAGHTFTLPSGAGFSVLAVSAWSGSAASPLDQTSSGVASVDTVSCGTITPTLNGELLVATYKMETEGTPAVTINSGFTITDQLPFTAGLFYGGAQAYLIQTSAAAVTPVWSSLGGAMRGPAVASFKVASGTGGLRLPSFLATVAAGYGLGLTHAIIRNSKTTRRGMLLPRNW